MGLCGPSSAPESKPKRVQGRAQLVKIKAWPPRGRRPRAAYSVVLLSHRRQLLWACALARWTERATHRRCTHALACTIISSCHRGRVARELCVLSAACACACVCVCVVKLPLNFALAVALRKEPHYGTICPLHSFNNH